MRNLFITCSTVIYATLLNYSFGQIRYDISFDTTSTANMKSVLRTITEGKSSYNRYTHPHHITFETMEDLSDEYFYSFNNSAFTIKTITRSTGRHKFVNKAGGNDCGAAELICSNTSFSANSSGPGTQELNASNQGCLYSENESSWYYINVQNSGTLEMLIDPVNNADDYDFAIWGPFTSATAATNCPPTSSPIRCSWSDLSDSTGMASTAFACTSWHWFWGYCTGYGIVSVTDNSEDDYGDSWVAPLNVNANDIYILLVDNFSNSGQPYNIEWSGSSTLGCTPIPLPVELVDFSVEKTAGGNLIEWKTSREVNNDYFLVETSTNNLNWKTISKVDASEIIDAEEDQINVYSSFHTDYSDQVNYYRLTQVDFNGQRETFHVVAIDNSVEQKTLLKIVNSMGQEIRADEPGLQFEIYDDGTCVRRYKQ